MSRQIHRYLDQAPEAISGSRGHLTTLRVARCLYNGFGLDECQVFAWLQIYNRRLSDKWSDRELVHKAKSAATGTYDKPRGWMLSATEATVLSHSQMMWVGGKEVVVQVPKHPPTGVKKAKKYVLATVATLPSYSHSSLTRAHTHARASHVSETTVATVADIAEAKRVAGELLKMHRDGAIKGKDDPEAHFYAQVIHTFGGVYLGKHMTRHV